MEKGRQIPLPDEMWEVPKQDVITGSSVSAEASPNTEAATHRITGGMRVYPLTRESRERYPARALHDVNVKEHSGETVLVRDYPRAKQRSLTAVEVLDDLHIEYPGQDGKKRFIDPGERVGVHKEKLRRPKKVSSEKT